jgi:hypothetical protein
METYVVVLTHKEKVEVEATSKEEAIHKAESIFSGKYFEPNAASVKKA